MVFVWASGFTTDLCHHEYHSFCADCRALKSFLGRRRALQHLVVFGLAVTACLSS